PREPARPGAAGGPGQAIGHPGSRRPLGSLAARRRQRHRGDRMRADREDDFDRGVRNRRAVLGDEWVDRSLGGADSFNAEFQALITRHAWHDIWSRPGLDHTTRRLLVLGMTMAQGRWEEFELHCRAAVRGGVALEKIRETLMQGAIYAGVPSANTAFK